MSLKHIHLTAIALFFPCLAGAQPLAVAQEDQLMPPAAPVVSTTTSTTTAQTYATTTAVTTTSPLYAVNPEMIPMVCGPVCGQVVPVVKSYHVGPDMGMVVSGAAVLGGLYMTTNLPVATALRMPSMYVPVFGPWIQASQFDSELGGIKALLVLDGMAQAAMLGLFIGGLATKQKTPIYERMILLPSASPSGGGVTAIGRF